MRLSLLQQSPIFRSFMTGTGSSPCDLDLFLPVEDLAGRKVCVEVRVEVKLMQDAMVEESPCEYLCIAMYNCYTLSILVSTVDVQ